MKYELNSLRQNRAGSNEQSLIDSLKSAGISEEDAAEFAGILAAEKPDTDAEPWGPKARAWLGNNLSKAAGGVWKASLSVATDVLTEAAKQFYGLK